MKFFITGCESFVAKNLIKELEKKRYDYFGVDYNCKNTKNTKKIDIRSKKILKYIPDGSIVVHLAALSTNEECNKDLSNTIDVNLNGTINLAIQSKKKNARQFIFASSEWVYGDVDNNQEQRENDKINILNMKSHYALSKIACESFLINNSQLNNLMILRFGIIFSDRSDKRGSALEKLFYEVKNKNEVIVGSKKTGRKFIHISDIISGIIKSSKKRGVHILNLTGNKLITLNEIIIKSSNILKKKIILKEVDSENYSIRKPSNKKAKRILNWEPKIDLKKGINLLKNKL